jgi:hypothetical protein
VIPGQRPAAQKEVPQSVVDEFAARLRPDGFTVEIDGVDHSDTYNECIASTKYQEPISDGVDPSLELTEKLEITEVTNEWIKCARENGFPNLVDVRVSKVDEFSTSPMAILPLTTSETELRNLIAACPVFNAERAQCAVNPSESSRCPPDPAIGFGDPNNPDATLMPEQQAAAEALEAVLWNEMVSFIEHQAGLP